MLMARIKRTDREQLFLVLKNDHSAAISRGDVVKWNTSAAAADLGNSVVPTGTGGNELIVAGVVHSDTIAVGDYGLIQCFGYHSYVKGHTDLSAAGITLITHTVAATAAAGAAASDPGAVFGVTLAAVSGGYVACWLRNM